ncbi:MAG: helix-turn-helix domain-containing protein [Proteobacteria bacterium]|nr:helix-turn-helix domain-containing protein [Pseudomonadota bacterium]
MKDDLFNELLKSVEQAGSIRRDETPAERVSVYKGKVLIEIREKGGVVWSLDQAAEKLRNAPAKKKRKSNPKDIREALQQTQEGFAELLGVSVRTLQNWEQGRRDPQGPAERLLNVASRHPVELLDSIQAA